MEIAGSGEFRFFDNSRHDGARLWAAEVTGGHKLELKCDPMPQWFQTAVWGKINPPHARNICPNREYYKRTIGA